MKEYVSELWWRDCQTHMRLAMLPRGGVADLMIGDHVVREAWTEVGGTIMVDPVADPDDAAIFLQLPYWELKQCGQNVSVRIVPEWLNDTGPMLTARVSFNQSAPMSLILYRDEVRWNVPWSWENAKGAIEDAVTAWNVDAGGDLLHVAEDEQGGNLHLSLAGEEGRPALAHLQIRWITGIVGFVVSTAATSLRRHNGEAAPAGIAEHFTFPQPILGACQQYLSYFGQFLADLGIRADTSIHAKANAVLFEVVPADGPEALARIREALDVFLDLPGSDQSRVRPNSADDVALVQLSANIMHLESQLMLARASMQLADAAIEGLRINNYRLVQIIKGDSKAMGTLPNAGPESPEAVGKYVMVKPVEMKGTGISFNTPQLLRDLKRRWLGAK